MSTIAQRVGIERVMLQSWVKKSQKTENIPQPHVKWRKQLTFEEAAKRLRDQMEYPRGSCPIELRRDAVALIDVGCPVMQLAQWLGVNDLTLLRWAKDCREDHGDGQDGQGR